MHRDVIPRFPGKLFQNNGLAPDFWALEGLNSRSGLAEMFGESSAVR